MAKFRMTDNEDKKDPSLENNIEKQMTESQEKMNSGEKDVAEDEGKVEPKSKISHTTRIIQSCLIIVSFVILVRIYLTRSENIQPVSEAVFVSKICKRTFWASRQG